MDWMLNNLPEALLLLGILLLAIEVLVLGFSTFVLFFVGIAAILTSGLLFFGLIPDSLTSATLSLGIITAVCALLLWKPLKQSQNNVDTNKAKNDLVGHSFVLTDAVSETQHPTYRYSGIDWKLTSSQAIAAGTKVEVIAVEVGQFTVAAAT